MCDYSEYSIVGPEHCFVVPCLTQGQFNLFSQNAQNLEIVLGFRTAQTSWEFTIAYYARSNSIKSISIKNIHGMVDNSELINEPLAEIVIWHWKENKQEIIKNELFERNKNNYTISLIFCNVSKLHLSIRLIEKRKLANEICLPLDFLDSDAFTISVGDQNFVVSANRLMQISPVFRRMLAVEMREKTERKVEVKDAEPEHFRAFLEVIDPDQNIRPNPKNVAEVLKLADRYEVNMAKNRCEMHLLNCVEMPLIERLQLADTYGLSKLKASILSFGSATLDVLYKANLDKFVKGQFSIAMLQELTSRIYNN